MDLSFFYSQQYLKIKYDMCKKYFNEDIKMHYLPSTLQFRRVDNKISLDSFYMHVYFDIPVSPIIDQLKDIKVKEFLVKYDVSDMKLNEIYFMPTDKSELKKLKLNLPDNHKFYDSSLFNFCEGKIKDYYITVDKTELYGFEKRYSLFSDGEVDIYYIPINSIYLVQRKKIFKLYHDIRKKFDFDINMNRPVVYSDKGDYESMYLFLNEEVVDSSQV